MAVYLRACDTFRGGASSPFAAGNTDIRPRSLCPAPAKLKRTCATRARIDEAKTAFDDPHSPPSPLLSLVLSIPTSFLVYPCCNWEIFFFFFGNSHFSLVTWLFRNMEIWNIWKRLGKFWDWKNEGVFAHRIYIAEQ